jgi:hypothetical protein
MKGLWDTLETVLIIPTIALIIVLLRTGIEEPSLIGDTLKLIVSIVGFVINWAILIALLWFLNLIKGLSRS